MAVQLESCSVVGRVIRENGGNRQGGKDGLLSLAELQELLLDIEVALNNRPLSYMDEDIRLPILTPSSFLYG